MKDTKFWKWFDTNFVYCGDTHSFVCRLKKELKLKRNVHIVQDMAFKVINDMYKEYDLRRKNK